MNSTVSSPSSSRHDPHSSREALLAAAERLFAERGFSQVSTRELAEAAGVNLGAIQYHFGSKSNLFLEAVHRMLMTCACLRSSLTEGGPVSSPEDAAIRVRDFIFGLMSYILRPTGPQATRVMCREVLSNDGDESAISEQFIDSVVSQFSKPTHDALVKVLSVLAPRATPDTLSLVVASIVGQCTFYVTHRPFVEKIRGEDLSADPAFLGICEHLVHFTLSGLGCSESLIAAALSSGAKFKDMDKK